MSLFKLVIKLCAWSLCVSLVSCYPQLQQGWKKRQVKSARQVSKLYDYIVVGGGQSGLVVANRLSENSNGKPNVQIIRSFQIHGAEVQHLIDERQ
jgi:hypothetical protein